MNKPILFVNIGWMQRYQGPSDDDPIRGNHAWLKKHTWGEEAWNFKPYRGKVYGSVPGFKSNFDLVKLGGSKQDELVNGVLVVFIAREPRLKQTRIVGWYQNATVYKDTGHASVKWPQHENEIQYCIVTNKSDAHLLLPLQRTMQIPTAKIAGNLGQSPRWYGGTDDFRKKVVQYIQSTLLAKNKLNSSQRSSPRTSNVAKRKEVEAAAIKHATEFYESDIGGSWTITSVETDNAGWDLTATRARETLKIEVKGLSGKTLSVDLTPNEFKKMSSPQHRCEYVVYVVTEAGSSKEKSHVFYYDANLSKSKQHAWIADDGRQLGIKPLIGARLTA